MVSERERVRTTAEASGLGSDLDVVSLQHFCFFACFNIDVLSIFAPFHCQDSTPCFYVELLVL